MDAHHAQTQLSAKDPREKFRLEAISRRIDQWINTNVPWSTVGFPSQGRGRGDEINSHVEGSLLLMPIWCGDCDGIYRTQRHDPMERAVCSGFNGFELVDQTLHCKTPLWRRATGDIWHVRGMTELVLQYAVGDTMSPALSRSNEGQRSSP